MDPAQTWRVIGDLSNEGKRFFSIFFRGNFELIPEKVS
jgi:hypothetical protein